ncbi:hypothetical protein EVAR_36549_1 [Eumeta japonica]|uniref:Reverse transcriptase domain-containing protein n=1 Tax=Eumeta variegata TaxID=151549 RepID=A0A4C1Z504_EUMVA|nr:hypothetical protein EVAR_36549_1 [Eumeta japonica]
MYDGLLKVILLRKAKLVAYADDMAIVTVTKHLLEINYVFDTTCERISQWIKSVNLKLAEHKTNGVLVSNRKKNGKNTLRVRNRVITSQPFLRYLRVVLDARFNFKRQVVHVGTKASVVAATLSRLIPNVGSPKEKRRAPLTFIITSVLTYHISFWADTFKMQESRR